MDHAKSGAARRGRLQGFVAEIERTEELKVDAEGNEWRKCIFVIELAGFSRRAPDEELPDELKGVKVKVVRWCCFDWHYRTGVKITLTPEETKAVLQGVRDLTRVR